MCGNGSTFEISLDGVNCHTKEPSPFNKEWHSHKFNGPRVRHEVGVCIQTGHVVWVAGLCPCGEWPDLRIARGNVICQVDANSNEMILADGGHNDGFKFFETPTGESDEDQKMKAEARARHETIDRQLKCWQCLEQEFHHKLHLHGT